MRRNPASSVAGEHLASYLDSHFAPNDVPPELSGLIYRKTEGHPLFSAALVQLLWERGDISRSNAHWTLARPLAELDLEVPENVLGMIRRKIEVLEDEDQRESPAAFGRRCIPPPPQRGCRVGDPGVGVAPRSNTPGILTRPPSFARHL
jgi:hypothetical protein